jgi:LCP family protein required for cell wall assembly
MPWLAALLSFIVPGFGQAYAGSWLLAALLVTPIFLLSVIVVLALVASPESLRNQVFSSQFLVGIFMLNAALLAWRVFAVAHAGLSTLTPALGAVPAGDTPAPRLDRGRATNLFVIGALLLVTVGMHAYVALVVTRFNDALGQVFEQPPAPRPPSGWAGTPPAETEPPVTGRDRTTFLFLGIDAREGFDSMLTDTILVVSVDPDGESAVMVSIPRDTGFTPLPDRRIHADGVYPGKINEIVAVATSNPELWCPDMAIDTPDDAKRCGIRSLERTVGLYLGIPINYYALVDFYGFESLIDSVGGVELCLPGHLVDPNFAGVETGQRGIVLPAGCHRYDGAGALVYARSRQGWIEMPDGTIETQTDFDRAERQQEVLLAVRGELAASGELFFELPALLEAVGSTVATNFPRSQAGDLAALVPVIAGQDIERVVLGYPEYVHLPVDPDTNYLLTPRRDAVRARMLELFADDATLDGWYVGSEEVGPPS